MVTTRVVPPDTNAAIAQGWLNANARADRHPLPLDFADPTIACVCGDGVLHRHVPVDAPQPAQAARQPAAAPEPTLSADAAQEPRAAGKNAQRSAISDGRLDGYPRRTRDTPSRSREARKLEARRYRARKRAKQT